MEQMGMKQRIQKGRLQMRLSFGHAKAGMSFESQADFDEYVDTTLGKAISFSLDATSSSPYVRRFGSVKRDDNWNKPARIMDLLSSIYKDKSSKLYYGFLNEHSHSFFRIISANLSIHKEASVFLPSLNDSTIQLDEKIIDEHLLMVYTRSHQNDIPGNPMPETGKYLPTNEAMMIVPPSYKEWKATQQRGFEHPPMLPNYQYFGLLSAQPGKKAEDEIVAITFRCEDGEY